MTRRIITPHIMAIVWGLAPALSGCSHAPLSDTKAVAGGTRDEVPRDGNGEPMLNAIRPMPASALAVARPTAS